jgi:hypothetical protein
MSKQATAVNLSYRDRLLNAHHAASQDFDKALMTLAGGALGISLAFIHDVAPHPHHRGWLEVSWGSLSFSLLLILVSFLTSQSALLGTISRHEKGVANPHRHGFARATLGLNWFSAMSFVVGVACLVGFALYNL